MPPSPFVFFPEHVQHDPDAGPDVNPRRYVLESDEFIDESEHIRPGKLKVLEYGDFNDPPPNRLGPDEYVDRNLGRERADKNAIPNVSSQKVRLSKVVCSPHSH